MNERLKIVYLDFDGVLHDSEVYFRIGRGIYLTTPGRSLFEWTPILEQLLEPWPDVKIVLSTSWVRVKNFDFAKSQLSPTLQDRVVGATFHNREMRSDEFQMLSRGRQIVEDVARRKPASWFAVDDDALGWPKGCLDNLIRTDGSRGISDSAVQQAIRAKLEMMR